MNASLKNVQALFDTIFAAPQMSEAVMPGGAEPRGQQTPTTSAVAAPISRQRMLESEIVEFRPDFNQAMELLDSLLCGLRFKFDDNLPADVENDFKALRESLNEADDYEVLHGR